MPVVLLLELAEIGVDKEVEEAVLLLTGVETSLKLFVEVEVTASLRFCPSCSDIVLDGVCCAAPAGVRIFLEGVD